MFVIFDSKLKELTGEFKTYNDAFFYYMATSFIERLKLYSHSLMNTEQIIDNIVMLRAIEQLIEDTAELLQANEPNYNLLQTKFCLANDYLNNPKGEPYKITMNIIRLDDNIRKINLKF